MSEVRADLGFNPMPVPSDFEEWYQHYPRKVARGAAEKAFLKARKIALLQELIAGAQRYAAQTGLKDRQFIKHPATWLNGKCWLDEFPREYGAPGVLPAEPAWKDAARRRCRLLAKGYRSAYLDPREVRLGIDEGIITAEMARRYGF